MPATAGRVRMPANNRVHSSAALQTTDIWQNAIGYDPYAPDATKQSDGENAYTSFQSLLTLARITKGPSNGDEARGACKRCGIVGHLTFQCRNFIESKEKDTLLVPVSSGAGKNAVERKDESEEDEEEEESEDSSDDSEIERIIAARTWEKIGGKRNAKSSEKRKRGKSKKRPSTSDSGEDERKRSKKRKKRYESSDEEGERKRSKEKRKKMYESSDEEGEHQRRRHHHSRRHRHDKKR